MSGLMHASRPFELDPESNSKPRRVHSTSMTGKNEWLGFPDFDGLRLRLIFDKQSHAASCIIKLQCRLQKEEGALAKVSTNGQALDSSSRRIKGVLRLFCLVIAIDLNARFATVQLTE